MLKDTRKGGGQKIFPGTSLKRAPRVFKLDYLRYFLTKGNEIAITTIKNIGVISFSANSKPKINRAPIKQNINTATEIAKLENKLLMIPNSFVFICI